MAIEQLLLFLSVTFFVSATPGPVMLAAMVQGAHHGIAQAHWGMLGATVGNIILVCIAAAGVGWLANQGHPAFKVLQWLGAGYLIFLGIRLGFRRHEMAARDTPNSTLTQWVLFRRSVVIACSNPKGIIYFATLLPPFVNIKLPLLPQFVLLTVIFAAIDYAWMLAYASAGAVMVRRLGDSQFGSWFNRCTGLVFVLVGGLLLASSFAVAGTA